MNVVWQFVITIKEIIMVIDTKSQLIKNLDRAEDYLSSANEESYEWNKNQILEDERRK